MNTLSNSKSNIVLTIKPVLLPTRSKPQDVFKPLSNKRWSIWLDSCESEHVDSNFDIIAWNPIVTIETHKNVTTIVEMISGDIKTSKEDPLSLLKSVNDTVFSNYDLPNSTLPFLGGAVGYFGYDLGRRFEKLPEEAIKDIEAPDMAIGLYDQALIYCRNSNLFYLLCPEEKRTETELLIQESIANKLENHCTANIPFRLMSRWQSNMTKAQYMKKFSRVQEFLLSGDCYQINLAQRFSAKYVGDEYEAYLALRKANSAPFSAFIKTEKNTLLSVSPERFLQLNGDNVQSKPIKGTRPRDKNIEQDKLNAQSLYSAPKDRAENLMIVDLLRNDISRVCKPGSVIVPKLFEIESFPAVHHLVSTVEGKLLHHYDGTDLLRAAFPGGSITGAPKIRAMEIIEELEPHQRNLYCGSIGYISANGRMDTSITIRTLICEKNTIYCWAGGGLVADSLVENEYQETYDKVERILPVLENINNVEQ